MHFHTNQLQFKRQSNPQTITLLEAIQRSFGREMRDVWAHYLSRRGTPRTLSSFNLGSRFRRHRNVRKAVAFMNSKAQGSIEKKLIATCQRNQGKDVRVTGFFHTEYETMPINVVDDPKLTLVGRGTLFISVRANVEFDCKQRVYTADGRIDIELRDSFVDVLDLTSTKPGNQELGGRGFKLSETWSENFRITRTRF